MSENVKKYKGNVVFFSNKMGYGFISWKSDEGEQKDMFVHFSDVSCNGYKTLYKNQDVEFELGINNRGQPKAANVKAL